MRGNCLPDQPDILGPRARTCIHRNRRAHGGRAQQVLRSIQGRSAPNVGRKNHRDRHQGFSSAQNASRLHLSERKERRRANLSSERRFNLQVAPESRQKRSSSRSVRNTRRPRGDSSEWRHNRDTQGRRRITPRNGDGRSSAPGMAQIGDARVDRYHHGSAAAVSYLRQHRRAESRAHQPQPVVAHTQSPRAA